MNICPTEEAIQAFLEYLVDPILSPKSSMRNTPSLSQQESVAKQVLFLLHLMTHVCLINETMLSFICVKVLLIKISV